MTPAELKAKGARTIYAQKTVDRRGAPMQMDDTSKVEGYMIDNGDGTYSNFLPDGTLERTYKPNNGLLGGLSQNLGSIADDTSGVIGKFILPAAAMGYGASLFNGVDPTLVAEGAVAEEAGSAGVGSAASSSPYSLSSGSATFGSASPAATNAAMGGTALGGAANVGATGLAGLLGSKAGVTLAGGLLGAMAGKDTTTTASKDPWGPAQPYLLDNLKTNAAMQQYYQANPFSDQQKTAYQGLLNSVANGQANAPVMSGIANNFMQSKRGVMPTMPQFTQGTTAPQINWAQYANIGKA